MKMKQLIMIGWAGVILAGCSRPVVLQAKTITATEVSTELANVEMISQESEGAGEVVYSQPAETIWISAGDVTKEESLNLVEKSELFNYDGQNFRLLIYSYAQFDSEGMLGHDDSGEWAAVVRVGDKKYPLMPTKVYYNMEMSGATYQGQDGMMHILINTNHIFSGYEYYDYVYDKHEDAFKLNYMISITGEHGTLRTTRNAYFFKD